MNSTPTGLRKITIALPAALVEFADQQAEAAGSNRSQIISQLIEQARRRKLEELAAEGYRLYAAEMAEFAEASAQAVAEAWSSTMHDNWDDL